MYTRLLPPTINRILPTRSVLYIYKVDYELRKYTRRPPTLGDYPNLYARVWARHNESARANRELLHKSGAKFEKFAATVVAINK